MYEISEAKDYYVFIEQRKNKIMDVSLELIGEACKLKEKTPGYQVVGILLGHNVSGLAHEAIAYGCDKVIVVDNPRLETFIPEPYTKAMSAVVQEFKPDGLLVGASTIGRDLGPRVAARCKTGLTADATILEVDPENPESKLLWFTRPAFGGNLFGTIICPNHRPQMATVRPGVMVKNAKDANRKGEIINFPVDITDADINVTLGKFVEKIVEGVDISDADIIVAGGRGVGSKEGFELLEKVAKQLGGEVAGSRAAIDAGWLKKNKQVGQTGKTVRPQVYIACGISGAVQHTAGMDGSEYIIAINKDKGAPIFDVAHTAIVGDLFEVLPKLADDLQAAKEAKK